MKRYYIQYGIGRAKYMVSFHNGVDKHKDGSDFYDLKILRNKKTLNAFIKSLVSNGYTVE